VKVVIVGCGRVGSETANQFDRAGHAVIILDSNTAAFDKLASSFGGQAIRGDGTDEDVLRRADAAGADVFLALTEGDNRNVMAAQLASEALGVPRVIAKINDPLRAKAYAQLGIATLCRTGLMVDAIDAFLGQPASGLPGMLEASGHHDGTPHIGSIALSAPPVAPMLAGTPIGTPIGTPGTPGTPAGTPGAIQEV
jgi:trk system potassium uptake protein TrkA